VWKWSGARPTGIYRRAARLRRHDEAELAIRRRLLRLRVVQLQGDAPLAHVDPACRVRNLDRQHLERLLAVRDDLVRLAGPHVDAGLGHEVVADVVRAEPEAPLAREDEQHVVPGRGREPRGRARLDVDDALPQPRAAVVGVERRLLADAVGRRRRPAAIPDQPGEGLHVPIS
jgi:hypothetical protein